MFDTMRTAAGAAPLVSTALAQGPHGLHGSRALAHALREAVLQAGEPPLHSGIHPLHWKMASPQQRAQLLRRQHFHGVFARHHGALTPAHAFKAQGLKAHGFFRVAHHGLRLGGHSLHGGLLRKVATALRAEQAASAQPAAAPAAAPAAPTAPATAPAAPLAHGAKTEAEAAQLAQITQQFQARFAQSAKDPAAFNALLKQAFGDHFDATKAETIRQQSLAGDFSWCPKIQLADAAQMRDLSGNQSEGVALGCYSTSEDTVLINRELLATDPAHAERILAEEMGHALDARLNTSDAAGDEGDIFSRLVHGEAISASQLAEMKADNDHGVIEINGKKTDVEYGWFKKLRKAVSGGLKKVVKAVAHGVQQGIKAAAHVAVGLVTLNFDKVQQGLREGVDAVKDTVKEVAKAVKETAKAIHKIVKEAALKLMQSKLFNAILMVAHFIPVLNFAALVVDAAKAAYMVYQGVKYKSLSMVLAGVASLATSAAGISTNVGLNGLAQTLTKVGGWAGQASQAYNAIAKKDIGAALGLMGMQPVQQAYSAVQAVRHGDTLGALSTVATIGETFSTSTPESSTWHDMGQVLQGAQAVQALAQGNFDAANNLASSLDLTQDAKAQSSADAAQARAQAAAQPGSSANAPDTAEATETPPADPKAKLREMEQRYRQSTDEGATSVSYRKDDRGLYGTALRASGGNAQDALVLLGLWKQDGLTLNDNGSPVVKDGASLRYQDVSQLPPEERQALQREGAQVLRNNSVTMERNREAQAQARAEAQAAKPSASASREPVWSFKEASQAQRKADDAREAQAVSAQGGGSPGAEMRAWDGKSNKPQERSAYDKFSRTAHVTLAGLGMFPGAGILADVADLALTAAEMPLGKSSKTDLGLAATAIGASIVPGADQAADAAKAASRLGHTAEEASAIAKVADGAAAVNVSSDAANIVAHEAHKDELIAAMSKPAVADSSLAKLIDPLYRPNASIGSGSTAAAVRQELATGQPVGGAFHSQKAEDSIRSLQRWLTNNPGARPGDRAAAENVIRDMQNALGGR